MPCFHMPGHNYESVAILISVQIYDDISFAVEIWHDHHVTVVAAGIKIIRQESVVVHIGQKFGGRKV